MLGVFGLELAHPVEDRDRFRTILRLVEPGDATVIDLDDPAHCLLVGQPPSRIHGNAGKRHIDIVVDVAEIVETCRGGCETEGWREDRGIDPSRREGREARGGCAGVGQIIVAGLDAKPIEHLLNVDPGDVLGSTHRDKLALDVGWTLDRRFRHQRIRRALDLHTQDCHRRAFFVRPDRINQS